MSCELSEWTTLTTGYKYDATKTRKADLSGKSCGGGGGGGGGGGRNENSSTADNLAGNVTAFHNPEDCVPLADDSVDGIVILHVLEHVLPLRPALEQLARIAKPGAWMQVEA